MATSAAQFITRFLGMLVLASAALFAWEGSAFAQEEEPEDTQDMSMQSPGQASGLGVGVESLLSGPSGPTIVYQTPMWHAEGILGVFDRANSSSLLVAGRFYYQVHAGDLSDFSVGGGIGLLNYDTGGMNGGNESDLHVEAGAKIRVFLAPNVALSTTLGFAMVLDEANDTALIAGRLQGAMGITYFFF